jgi:hypothetical protein
MLKRIYRWYLFSKTGDGIWLPLLSSFALFNEDNMMLFYSLGYLVVLVTFKLRCRIDNVELPSKFMSSTNFVLCYWSP